MPQGPSDTFSVDYPLDPPNHTPDGETQVYRVQLPRDVVPTTKTLIELGAHKLQVPPLGFGTWTFGDLLTFGWGPSGGYDKRLNDDSCYQAWTEMMKSFPECVLIDTAEHYGYTDGYCEKLIGRCHQMYKKEFGDEHMPEVILATKYLPTPWRFPWTYPGQVLRSMEGSLARTQLGKIDIYQLHGPSNWLVWPRFKTLAESLADAWATGHVKAVGVCNLSWPQVKYMYQCLRRRGIQLVSNQVEFSLLRMDPWTTGLVENCRKLGIATIAYSPLAVGRLTGKYHSGNRPKGNRNFGDIAWYKIEPVVDELISIGRKYGKTPTQVALNWIICKGAIPIPACKNKEQVADCMGALGWKLEQEDEERLDALGCINDWDWNLLKHFQNWWWQQG